MTPLTHHDIVRLSAPFTKLGWRVDLQASVRAERRVRFASRQVTLAGSDACDVFHELTASERGELDVRRALWHPAGVASVVQARGHDNTRLAQALDAIPLTDQLMELEQTPCALSFRLWLAGSDGYSGSDSLDTGNRVELTHLAARIQHLVLAIDVTTGGGMPTDVTLAAAGSAVNGPQNVPTAGQHPARQRATLASGDWLPAFDPLLRHCTPAASCAAELPQLPDDLLAILGNHWRPLRPYGDHFRTVLRGLGRDRRRADRAIASFTEAVAHLQQVLQAPATRYHATFRAQRRTVFLRRLRPVFLLIGILALMPVMYLAVNSGGMTLHPLMLGLTPLLMVAAVALSVREIPVMEWPAWPAPLPADTFTSSQTTITRS